MNAPLPGREKPKTPVKRKAELTAGEDSGFMALHGTRKGGD